MVTAECACRVLLAPCETVIHSEIFKTPPFFFFDCELTFKDLETLNVCHLGILVGAAIKCVINATQYMCFTSMAHCGDSVCDYM